MGALNSIRPALLYGALLGPLVLGNVQAQTVPLHEALDASNLVWTTGGDAPWFGQSTNSYDGVSAGCSMLSAPGKTSWLQTTVVGPGTLSFWSKKDGGTGFPSPGWLTFAVNPIPGGPGMPGSPANWPWQQSTYDLPGGTNILRWTFSTSPTASNFVTAAYLDQVAIGSPRPLGIQYQPFDQTVYAREFASLSVQVIGTPPFTYQWLKNNNKIAGATNSWLYFESASTNDTGSYSVVVSNQLTFVVSSNAVLTVLPPAAPSISYPPYDQTVYSGQTAGWSAPATGSPPFSYQWLRDGTNLPGATTWSLFLSNVQLSDAGDYQIQVTNTEGSFISTNARLTVLQSAPPLITVQPCSLMVAAGASPELSVQASGAPDPQFQWLRNGTNIPGARYESLGFSNITAEAAGVYSVRVSNLAGTVQSGAATMRVLPPLVASGSWAQQADNVTVTNEVAYVAQGASGVAFLAVSNPAAPVLLATFDTIGGATAVRVVGSRAYVADASAGLHILSVTNLGNPVQLGTHNTPGFAADVCVAGNVAYIADWSSGLEIVDLSDAAHPVLLGSFVTNMAAGSVRVAGNFAYVGCPAVISLPGQPMVDGLQILDISDASRPEMVGLTYHDVNGFDLVSNLVVTGGANSGVSLFDVSNPSTPTQIGYYSPPGLRPRNSAFDLQVVGHLVYVARGSDGISVLDLSVPSAPVHVANFLTSGFAVKIAVSGNRVYVALQSAGLQIIDIPEALGIHPGLSIQGGAPVKLTVSGPAGSRVRLEYAAALTDLQWQPLEAVTLTNGSAVVEAPDSGSEPRFFRARTVEQ